MSYVITGLLDGRREELGRRAAASAAVVAAALQDQGYTDVLIVDGAGLRLTLDAFRLRYWGPPAPAKRRRLWSFGRAIRFG